MKERVNVFAKIRGRKEWHVLGTIIKEPDQKIDLEKAVETYFEQGKAYGYVCRNKKL